MKWLAILGALALAVDPPPPPPPAGHLTIRTDVPATVKVDGVPMGDTPLQRIQLLDGPHHLELWSEKRKLRLRRQIVVRKDEELRLKLELSLDAGAQPVRP